MQNSTDPVMSPDRAQKILSVGPQLGAPPTRRPFIHATSAESRMVRDWLQQLLVRSLWQITAGELARQMPLQTVTRAHIMWTQNRRRDRALSCGDRARSKSVPWKPTTAYGAEFSRGCRSLGHLLRADYAYRGGTMAHSIVKGGIVAPSSRINVFRFALPRSANRKSRVRGAAG